MTGPGTPAGASPAAGPPEVDADLVAALRAAPLLTPLPDDAVRRFAGSGVPLRVPAGGHLADEGDEQAWFHLLLQGRVEWTRRVNGVDVHVLTHTAGMYFGHEPILLDIPVPVTGTALEPVWAFRFHAAGFWELLASCPQVRKELLSAVSSRVATLEGVTQQQAKLAALGTLSAGLAHELNNPAAAVRSAVAPLAQAFRDVSATALHLGRDLPDGELLAWLAELQREATAAQAADPRSRSALEQADAEDALTTWLADRDVDRAWELAPELLGAGLHVGQLDRVAARVPAAALGDAVSWLAATATGTALLQEVGEGAGRIADLVHAMREYTYLDQGQRQQVDVHAGLDSTLTILAHKLRGRIEVVRDYDPDLPTISASGSELNQVWTNLIDNAADAMPGGGRLTLTTRREGDRVLVDIADTGQGVPPELLDRIFDQYFTTKGVGKGTGLGLDITRRIVVDTHRGDLRVTSEPGNTHVAVRLPLTTR